MTVKNFAAGSGYTAGSSTTVALDTSPGSEQNAVVYFDGLAQHHDTWSVSGTTVTFSSAIPSSVANVEVRYGSTLAINAPADGTVSAATIASSAVTTAKVADLNITTGKLAAGAVTIAKADNGLIPYDIGFSAGYGTDGVKADLVAQVYSNMVLGRNVTIEGFEAVCETAPVGSDLEMDVQKNGTTIFSTRPEIDAGATADDTNHALSVTTAAAGDRITFKVHAIGSSTAGQGLSATLKTRLR